MVQTIDHTAQLGAVLDHFDPTSANRPDRAYFFFEATQQDCPRALADHIYIELCQFAPQTDSLAIPLRPYRQGNAIWKALLKIVPRGREQESSEAAQQCVFDWINSRGLTVLYVVVRAGKQRELLSEMIKDACSALDALPRFDKGVRLILVIAFLKSTGKRSFLRRISGWKPSPRVTHLCRTLEPLRKLKREDIEEWLDGFTLEQKRRYREERLLIELGDLLKERAWPY